MPHNIICNTCSSEFITEDKRRRFCSRSCAAINRNIERKKHGGSFGPAPKYSNRKCEYCGKLLNITQKRFCSVSCRTVSRGGVDLKLWLKGEQDGGTGAWSRLAQNVRNFLLEEAEYKCTKCGWSEKNKTTGDPPLEIHHKDNNYKNNSRNNLVVLCPNCHAIENTYKNSGRKSAQVYRRR